MPLTAQQLVNLSLQVVKAPGFTAQAGQLLNMLLADLADMQNMDLGRGTYVFNMTVDNGQGSGSGPYQMPADYKRVEKKGALYVYDGTPYQLAPISYTEYLNQIQQPGIANFPTYFATDISPQGLEPPQPVNLYVWPPASQAFPTTIVYRLLRPDIANPEHSKVIPWFPDQGYIMAELNGRLCALVDDSRADRFFAESRARLTNFMQQTNDDQGRGVTVSLSQTRFGTAWGALRTTKQVGWF